MIKFIRISNISLHIILYSTLFSNYLFNIHHDDLTSNKQTGNILFNHPWMALAGYRFTSAFFPHVCVGIEFTYQMLIHNTSIKYGKPKRKTFSIHFNIFRHNLNNEFGWFSFLLLSQNDIQKFTPHFYWIKEEFHEHWTSLLPYVHSLDFDYFFPERLKRRPFRFY